ncbi:hypothetical protein LPJ53_002620 [Coemansia erecta]|uniref:Zinc finger PHD-type domain-containing protein n=1 Tax=Coemansia erecta TaxID=147472 RepID=A0A9W7Y348_9FUNG|nr:hypothetical protein LPJ53_002620 [Coemansia erecta]
MPFATGGYSAGALQLRAGRLRDTRGFAQLAHFVYVFRQALRLDEHAPSIDQLEHELTALAERRPLLTHILEHVLQLLSPRAPVHPLDAAVARAWRREGLQPPGDVREALSDGDSGGGSGDVALRLAVVGGTCELVCVRPERLRAAPGVAGLAPAEMRAAAVGRDALGRAYWLLCGHLLYRETPAHVADVLLPSSSSSLVAGEVRRSARGRRGKERVVRVEDLEACDAPRHAMREADGALWELLVGGGAGREWAAVAAAAGGGAGLLGREARGADERRLVEEVGRWAGDAARKALACRRSAGRVAGPAGEHVRLLLAAEGGRKRSARIAGLRERRPAGPEDGGDSVDQGAGPDQAAPDQRDSRGARASRRQMAREAALSAVGQQPVAMHEEAQEAEEGEADHWAFCCSCGIRGADYDDGRAMTACERCGVWRHLGCALRAESRRIGRAIDEDDWDTVRYVCPECLCVDAGKL